MKYTKIHAAKIDTDIHQHLIRLYDLVVELNAKRVLELGVRGGESTVALLEGVHRTEGTLYSVDVAPCVEARDLIESYRLGSRWTFYQANDLEFGKGQIGEMDLIFIDTSHEYQHTVDEIKLYAPLLRKGGAFAFHDTESFPDVMRAIQDTILDWPIELWTNNNGLGIARKP